MDGQDGFGCRILAVFKGAGFDFSFPSQRPGFLRIPQRLFDFFLQQVDNYAGASDATLQRLRYLREAVLLRAWTPEQAAQDALNRRDALPSAPEEDRAAFYRFAMDMRSEP